MQEWWWGHEEALCQDQSQVQLLENCQICWSVREEVGVGEDHHGGGDEQTNEGWERRRKAAVAATVAIGGIEEPVIKWGWTCDKRLILRGRKCFLACCSSCASVEVASWRAIAWEPRPSASRPARRRNKEGADKGRIDCLRLWSLHLPLLQIKMILVVFNHRY